MICKRCGKPIKSKSLKCGSCGEKHLSSECSGLEYDPAPSVWVTETVSEPTTLIAKLLDKKKIPMIAGVAAVVVACAAVFSLVASKKDDEGNGPVKQNYGTTPGHEAVLADDMHTRFAELGEFSPENEVLTEDDAKVQLKKVKEIYGIEDIEKEFAAPIKVEKEGTHYIFQQLKNDKPVEGRSMIVSVYKNKNVIITGNYGKEKAEAKPVVCVGSEENAIKILERLDSNKNSEADNGKPDENKDRENGGRGLIVSEEEPAETMAEATPENTAVVSKNGSDSKTNKQESNKKDSEKDDSNENAAEESENDDKDVICYLDEESKTVVIKPRSDDETVQFRSPVVSNALYVMFKSSDKIDEKLDEKLLEDIWEDASYLLTADATHDDVMRALQYVAGKMGYSDVFNEVGTPQKNVELISEGAKIRIYPNDREFSYKIIKCDEYLKGNENPLFNSNEDDGDYKFKAGEYYCVIIAERNSGKTATAYVYCTKEKLADGTIADLVFYTPFGELPNNDSEPQNGDSE